VVSTGANSVFNEVFHISVQGLKETAWTLPLKVSEQIKSSQPFTAVNHLLILQVA
jgi:hypothetical protein